MGYSSDEKMVRADRFKESGKWYDTFALDMGEEFHFAETTVAVHTALNRMCSESEGARPVAESGWFVVVLDPHHQHPYPVVAWGRSDGTWGYKESGLVFEEQTARADRLAAALRPLVDELDNEYPENWDPDLCEKMQREAKAALKG